MSDKMYKPSNKFSIAGFIFIILAVAVLGSVLAPLYLKLTAWIPFVYLNIFLACLYGLVLGLTVKLIVTKVKVRSALTVILSVLIGSVVFTAFKWSVYCYWDHSYVLGEDVSLSEFTDDELEVLNENFANYYDTDAKVLRSPFAYFSSPSELINYIEMINKEGRWSYKSSSSSSVPEKPVTGAILWLVWLFEAGVIIIIPLLMGVNRSKIPFIEQDNEWALVYGKVHLFNNVNLKTKKQEFIQNPYEIFNYELVKDVRATRDYTSLTLYHSQNYDEGYISLARHYFNEKNKKFNEVLKVEFIKVDKAYIDMVWTESFLKQAENEAQKAAEEASQAAMKSYEYASYEAAPMDGISAPVNADSDYSELISDIEPK